MFSLCGFFREPVPPVRAKTALTIPAADVVPARRGMRHEPYFRAVRHLIGRHVEAASRYHGRLVRFGSLLRRQRPANPLIAAMHAAYLHHYPVVISPDVIWLTLAQGLARHICANSEELRDRFVSYPGRKELVVRRDDFRKGSSENPWPEAFAAFSELIRDHIGPERHDLFVADFSTTTPTARAATEVVLFDAMQPYCRYTFLGLCGIPSVILEGTSGDWLSITARVRRFVEFGLERWTDALVPVLESITAAAAGQVDREFWSEMYAWRRSGCNPAFVRGWGKFLFPYVKAPQENGAELIPSPMFDADPRTWAPEPDGFPTGHSEVPFVWDCRGRSFDMRFVGGLLGVAQDADTLALRPEIGWAVCDDTPAHP